MARIKGWVKVGKDHWYARSPRINREVEIKKGFLTDSAGYDVIIRRISNNHILHYYSYKTKKKAFAKAMKYMRDTR